MSVVPSPHKQAVLTTVLIDVKQAVVHGNCVGAIYHILCGRADRQVKYGTRTDGRVAT